MTTRRVGFVLPIFVAALVALFLAAGPAGASSRLDWTGQGVTGDHINKELCGTENGAQVDGD